MLHDLSNALARDALSRADLGQCRGVRWYFGTVEQILQTSFGEGAISRCIGAWDRVPHGELHVGQGAIQGVSTLSPHDVRRDVQLHVACFGSDLETHVVSSLLFQLVPEAVQPVDGCALILRDAHGVTLFNDGHLNMVADPCDRIGDETVLAGCIGLICRLNETDVASADEVS